MARRHGKNGSVSMDPAGGSTYVVIASLKSWSLDAESENVNVTAFQDANRQYVKGLPDYKGDLGGWWDSTEGSLFDAAFDQTPVGLKLTPSTVDTALFFAGPAYVDSGIDVDAEGAVAVNGSWVAAGNWTPPAFA